jgi:hypothetical protein
LFHIKKRHKVAENIKKILKIKCLICEWNYYGLTLKILYELNWQSWVNKVGKCKLLRKVKSYEEKKRNKA